jgi:cytoskeletal protein CcmA (bactofilin family)
MKLLRIAIATAAIVSLAVLTPTIAMAASTKTGNDMSLVKSETHDGTLYAYGQTLIIDGNIKGDLVCAAETVTVNGDVSGDILCAAQNLTINGAVGGNVRIIGQTVTLNGTIGKNLNAAAQSVTTGPQAKIGSEAGILAETTTLRGPIGSNLYGSMSTLNLKSTVNGNVDVYVETLALASDAEIGGNLGYASSATFAIDPSKVGGTIRRSDPPQGSAHSTTNSFSFAGWFAERLYVLAAILVIALPLVWFAPRLLNRLVKTMLDKPGPSIGWGFVGLAILPFAGLIAFMTIIGIPLAILGLVGWAVLFFTSNIFAGIALGKVVLSRMSWNKDSLGWAALIGSVLLIVVTSLPILGFLVSVVALWWVAGGLILSSKYLRN